MVFRLRHEAIPHLDESLQASQLLRTTRIVPQTCQELSLTGVKYRAIE
jgi:hypothetical protein